MPTNQDFRVAAGSHEAAATPMLPSPGIPKHEGGGANLPAEDSVAAPAAAAGHITQHLVKLDAHVVPMHLY